MKNKLIIKNKQIIILIFTINNKQVGVNCQMDDMPESMKAVMDTCLNKFDISKGKNFYKCFQFKEKNF